MASTLGFTGMDSATETALTAAFQQASAELGNTWQLRPEADADHVIVDMDSMYGPMSWLRLHAAGKRVIGLTSAHRTQTDFHLGRPFDAASVAALLRTVQQGAGAAALSLPAAAPAPSASATPAAAAATAALPSGMSPSPVPQDQLPEEHPQPIDEEAEAPPPSPGLPGSAQAGTLAPATIIPAPVAPPAPPAPPPRERGLADWLAPGMLNGHLRFRPSSGQPILIDATTRQYFATPSLKPLAPAVEGVVARDDFEPVDGATWTRETAALGAAQPLNRLQWYAGLLAGKGELLSEFDPAGRYRLGKWPQTEREFPKHFRIATAMMKGPATLDEIATTSGVPLGDVVDFVNASLVTGYAEAVREAPAEAAEAPKPVGLLGRLRGK
jgi:hypothetical protein